MSKHEITNKDQPQGTVGEKSTFFGRDVVDYGSVLGTRSFVEPHTVYGIAYSKGTIYVTFEEVKPGSFNPLTWSHQYNRRFTVEHTEEKGIWKARTIVTEIGEVPKESKEKFTEELNQLLKTKVGSEWLERRIYSLDQI